jgi:two-component system response regulator AtoC
LPPLRKRIEDISFLANYFLQRFALETKKSFSAITDAALARLCDYPWPGNVRELANVIERGVVLGDGPEFSVDCLPSRLVGDGSLAPAEILPFHEAVNSHRRTLIVDALARAQGNRAAAAKALGLHRTHLLKLMKALRIS